MTVEKLIKTLKKFNPKDEVIFYHLKNHNLKSCEFESVIETELGVELTIEEEPDECWDNNIVLTVCINSSRFCSLV